MPLIAPSLLSANFANLIVDIEMINESEADWFHLDVMDGLFVPNISFGIPVIRSVKKFAKKPLDVHLMIVEPQRYIQMFCDYGANILSVHYEACTHLHSTVSAIKTAGMQAGVVLNPHTPVHLLENIIEDADVILLMSVNPGFGGQKFIENTYSKISSLKELIISKKSLAKIEIDGGVGLDNATKLCDVGADILVAGNSIFFASDPKIQINRLKGSY